MDKTKICPECASKVSVEAKRCPNCKKNLRGWFGRHPILTFLLIMFVVGVIVSTEMGRSVSTQPVQEARYAYNATNDVFQGKILYEKACRTNSNLECYVVSRGTEYVNDEHPVSNVTVRSYKPSIPPEWYSGSDWSSWN
jgi:hypothetical protein